MFIQFTLYKDKYKKNHFGDKRSVQEPSTTNDSLLTFISYDVNEGKREECRSSDFSYDFFQGLKKYKM